MVETSIRLPVTEEKRRKSNRIREKSRGSTAQLPPPPTTQKRKTKALQAAKQNNTAQKTRTRGKYMKLNQRLEFLKNDSSVVDFTSPVVTCICDAEITLDTRDGGLYLDRWLNHKEICKGISDKENEKPGRVIPLSEEDVAMSVEDAEESGKEDAELEYDSTEPEAEVSVTSRPHTPPGIRTSPLDAALAKFFSQENSQRRLTESAPSRCSFSPNDDGLHLLKPGKFTLVPARWDETPPHYGARRAFMSKPPQGPTNWLREQLPSSGFERWRQNVGCMAAKSLEAQMHPISGLQAPGQQGHHQQLHMQESRSNTENQAHRFTIPKPTQGERSWLDTVLRND
ncbi:hypothetical protein Hypma_014261 [Hypsizygus marmoreus]|uniref:Uncharacterized protein n=1 Tax=Hypsizygus marmoreus TaxID=39966 RepID=A0A369JAN4_HYPMA|nr:hypothetical protein Hypma_014261 [Hypsizygus marmoreus]